VADLGPLLQRRVLHHPEFLKFNGNLGRWVPTRAAVQFDPDGLSTFAAHLLAENHHGAADVASLGNTSQKPAVVFQMESNAAASTGCVAEASPNTDTSIGYAHWSVIAPNDIDRGDRRRIQNELCEFLSQDHIFGTISLPRPQDVP